MKHYLCINILEAMLKVVNQYHKLGLLYQEKVNAELVRFITCMLGVVLILRRQIIYILTAPPFPLVRFCQIPPPLFGQSD